MKASGTGEGWTTASLGRTGVFKVLFHGTFRDIAGLWAGSLLDRLPCLFSGVQASPISAFDVKMTKLGFLRLSYEKQDTLLKLLILSMAAVLCKSASCCAGLADGCQCSQRGTPGCSHLCSLLLFFYRLRSSHLSQGSALIPSVSVPL